MGGDVWKELCKRNLGGKENGKGRQPATGNGFGRAREQIGEK